MAKNKATHMMVPLSQEKYVPCSGTDSDVCCWRYCWFASESAPACLDDGRLCKSGWWVWIRIKILVY